ncbi:MAG TPA: hypothetical protein VF074_23920 [Pyrinomonadaceae bacterium]
MKKTLLTKDASVTNERNSQECTPTESGINRRWFGTGLFVALLGGPLLRTAQAFPESAQNHFNAATRILNRYGLSVAGMFDQTLGHDVLSVTSIPPTETQHDFVGAELNAAAGIDPCWKTSSFQGSTDFTTFEENQAGGILPCTKTTVAGENTIFEHFDMNQAGGIIPCTKTTVAGEQTIFEQLDTNQAGGIIPCSKTIIEEPLSTHMVFDPNVAGGIEPCIIVGAERKVDDTLGPVEVVVNHPELNFTVRIGPRIYRLVGGALVEEVTG